VLVRRLGAGVVALVDLRWGSEKMNESEPGKRLRKTKGNGEGDDRKAKGSDQKWTRKRDAVETEVHAKAADARPANENIHCRFQSPILDSSIVRQIRGVVLNIPSSIKIPNRELFCKWKTKPTMHREELVRRQQARKPISQNSLLARCWPLLGCRDAHGKRHAMPYLTGLCRVSEGGAATEAHGSQPFFFLLFQMARALFLFLSAGRRSGARLVLARSSFCWIE